MKLRPELDNLNSKHAGSSISKHNPAKLNNKKSAPISTNETKPGTRPTETKPKRMQGTGLPSTTKAHTVEKRKDSNGFLLKAATARQKFFSVQRSERRSNKVRWLGQVRPVCEGAEVRPVEG
jgi:hypothetical protein